MAPKQLSSLGSTVETLGEPGDLTAAPGSRAWAIAVRLEMQSGIRDTKSDAASVLSWRRLFEKHEGYRVLPDEHGQPFSSYRAFCEAAPPWGLGYDPDVLAQVLEERKTAQAAAGAAIPLAAHGEIGNGRSRGRWPTSTGKRDNEYLAGRIARDRPDILERMKAGEYKSVRAAALEAGIVKPTMTVPAEPRAAMRALIRKFGRDVAAAAFADEYAADG